MTVTIWVHINKSTRTPKDFCRVMPFDVEVSVLPRVGEALWLNGMQETFDEESLKDNPFWLGDGYEEAAEVTQIEHFPFESSRDTKTHVSVMISKKDSRTILGYAAHIQEQP